MTIRNVFKILFSSLTIFCMAEVVNAASLETRLQTRPYYLSPAHADVADPDFVRSLLPVWHWLLEHFTEVSGHFNAKLKEDASLPSSHFSNWQPECLERISPIVFDLDETLIASMDVPATLAPSLRLVLKQNGHAFREAMSSRSIYLGSNQIQLISFMLVRRGAQELLAYVKENFKLFIFTAANKEYCRIVMTLLGLEGACDAADEDDEDGVELALSRGSCYTRPILAKLPDHIAPDLHPGIRANINGILAYLSTEPIKYMSDARLRPNDVLFFDDYIRNAIGQPNNTIVVPKFEFKASPNDPDADKKFIAWLQNDDALIKVLAKLKEKFGEIVNDPRELRKDLVVGQLAAELNEAVGVDLDSLKEQVELAQAEYSLNLDIKQLKELIEFWQNWLSEKTAKRLRMGFLSSGIRPRY